MLKANLVQIFLQGNSDHVFHKMGEMAGGNVFLRRDILEGEGVGKMFRDIVCDPVQAVGIIPGGGGGFPGGETAVGGGQNLVQSVEEQGKAF